MPPAHNISILPEVDGVAHQSRRKREGIHDGHAIANRGNRRRCRRGSEGGGEDECGYSRKDVFVAGVGVVGIGIKYEACSESLEIYVIFNENITIVESLIVFFIY
jgi:hypothetical protein